MTDKEMAEAWVNYHYDPAVKLTRHSLEGAFLAGLKEGKPVWHKVADGDLPDNTDNVLSDKGVIVYYNFTHACWVDERASVEIDDVIAWCEISTYKEV